MAVLNEISPAQLGHLIQVAKPHGATIPPLLRSHVFELCATAIIAADAGAGLHRGRTARSAARLLLDIDCPWLGEALAQQFAEACERAVALAIPPEHSF